ncbi:MAG: hypothetical protein QW292_08120, partial [Candidatus Parvarchaeota archaeon]
SGSPVSVSVTFTQVKYSVTFSETGLPSGSTWYVNITNGPDSGAITGSSYSFSLTNGTYSYTIVTTDKTYEPSPSSGSFILSGTSVSESVTFSEVKYKVTFTEIGLPTGSTWSVTLSGTAFNGQYVNSTLTSSTGTITFNEPNGTYSYAVHLPSGYQGTNQKESVTVAGSKVTITITASTTTNYLLIEIIVIVIIIVVIAGVLVNKNEKKKGGPRQGQDPAEEQNEEKK